MRERVVLTERSFAELRVWRVPNSVRRSEHSFKYTLAYVVDRVCVLRHDNEAGKGDHKHVGEIESPYEFTTPEQLLADFWNDVDRWRP